MFNLMDHIQNIRRMANNNPNMTVEEAMDKFLANLATMKEHFKGCPDLNYHELGQAWNKLPGAVRNEQKAQVRKKLASYRRSGGAE